MEAFAPLARLIDLIRMWCFVWIGVPPFLARAQHVRFSLQDRLRNSS